MRNLRSIFVIAGIVTLIVLPVCMAAPIEKNQFHIRGGKLWRETQPFTVWAIETPSLLEAGNSPADLAKILNRVAETGANAVCFDLRGFSPDGASLSPEAVKTIETVMGHVTWRRMGGLCRVLGKGAPPDAALRMAGVHAAATALKAERRILYWIDGPDGPALAAEFKKLAPDLVVAAEQGGDLDIVTALPARETAKPALVVGAIPPAELRDSVHCVMPDGDATYAAFEAAMKDPAETRPWTPDNSTLTEQERAEGFVSLFDGKTLDSWRIIGKNQRGFAVSDGAIEWKSLGGAALYTRVRYDNFIFRLEWKINKRGNSGIYLRAPRAGRQSKIGMEFQLQGDAGGQPVTNQTTGAVYDVMPPKINAAKPEGEWNTLEITLNGPMLKAVLNGQTVQDINLDENDELRVRLRRGFIGLQDHGSYVAFRNIRIKQI